MGKHSEPDPNGVEALGEAVNEVYRSMAISPEDVFPHVDHVHADWPPVEPEVIEAYRTIYRYAADPDSRQPGVGVLLSGEQAGELVLMASAYALAHQLTDHPGVSWTECALHTQIMGHVCRIYLAAMSGGAL